MVSTTAPHRPLPKKEPEASGGMSGSSFESRKAQDKSEHLVPESAETT